MAVPALEDRLSQGIQMPTGVVSPLEVSRNYPKWLYNGNVVPTWHQPNGIGSRTSNKHSLLLAEDGRCRHMSCDRWNVARRLLKSQHCWQCAMRPISFGIPCRRRQIPDIGFCTEGLQTTPFCHISLNSNSQTHSTGDKNSYNLMSAGWLIQEVGSTWRPRLLWHDTVRQKFGPRHRKRWHYVLSGGGAKEWWGQVAGSGRRQTSQLGWWGSLVVECLLGNVEGNPCSRGAEGVPRVRGRLLAESLCSASVAGTRAISLDLQHGRGGSSPSLQRQGSDASTLSPADAQHCNGASEDAHYQHHQENGHKQAHA